MSMEETKRNENVETVITMPEVSMPKTAAEVVPLNYETALRAFTGEEQKEIIDLSTQIDVRKVDNIMSYGSNALKTTFEQCGDFLKDERGSDADQQVIKQVIELSKKASESYDDFNLVLQEPNFFQKILLKLSKGAQDSRTEKIQTSAVTNYKLLAELKESCDEWLSMLQKAMGDISSSAISDIDTSMLLDKYLIAGNMAKDRVEQEMEAVKTKYQETGLQKYAQEYEQIKEGYDIFVLTLSNLEKSRVMYHLSIGQLALIRRSNRNVQVSIHTQMGNSLALIGQQLRNAVLNEKTKEVLEGQKAIAKLSDELIKHVSKSVGLTTQDTEKLIYAGFYNLEAAREAVKIVMDSCNEIQKTASEMLPKMKAETAELNSLMKELEPCVERVVQKQDSTLSIKAKGTHKDEGGLKF